MEKCDSTGCYIQRILGMVFHESSNAGLIVEETSLQIYKMIFKAFLMKKSECPKFLTWFKF
jgi:hypothetical protein